MLRNHYQSERYHHQGIGYNYRMDGIQGAVLSIKLAYLTRWTKKRNTLAKNYKEKLSHIDFIQVPHIEDDIVSSFHLYVIHLKNRMNLFNHLKDNGVHCGLHYPVPIHLQNAYKNLGYKKGDFPISEKNAKHCLSLPLYPELSMQKLDYIVESISNYKP